MGEGFVYYLILAGIVILMIALPTMDEVRNFFSAEKQQVETSQRTTVPTKEEDWRKGEDNSPLPADYEENRIEQSGIDYDTDLTPPGDINEF